MIEHVEDLEPDRSFVRIIDTGEQAVFSHMEGENIHVKRKGEILSFTRDKLTYLGTPGTDSPYADDYEIYF